MKFDGLTQQEFQSVTDGKITVSEALDNLQTKGQQILLEEKSREGGGEKADPKPDVADQTIEGSMSSTASMTMQ